MSHDSSLRQETDPLEYKISSGASGSQMSNRHETPYSRLSRRQLLTKALLPI
jgi:hypothetical protein